MIDELTILREFRAELAVVDAAALERIRATVQGVVELDAVQRAGRGDDDLGEPVYVARPNGHAGSSRPRRHRLLAVAAAVAIVAVAAGALAWNGLRDETGVANSSSAPLIADPAPAGLDLMGPIFGSIESHTVYTPGGDPPLGEMLSLAAMDISSPKRTSREEVVRRTMSAGDFHEVAFSVDDGYLAATGRGMSQDEFIEAVTQATVDRLGRPTLPWSARPAGWSEWINPDAADSTFDERIGVAYFDESRYPTGISWQQWSGSVDDLARTIELELPIVEICGRGAACEAATEGSSATVLGRWPEVDDEPVGESDHLATRMVLTWLEDGRRITISSFGSSLQELYEIARSLRPSTWEEIEELTADPDPTVDTTRDLGTTETTGGSMRSSD